MNDVIETKTIGKGIAETTPFVIERTPETRLVFYPMVHSGGVRGVIVRYKKKRGDDWKKLRPDDFEKKTLSPGESFDILFKTGTLHNFLEEINKRKKIVADGVEYGSHEYITVEKNRVIIINDTNKKQILEQILEKGYSDEYWNLIQESVPDLADRLTNARVQDRKKEVINEFTTRLKKGGYAETTGGDSWQRWIYNNNWLFGINYKIPIEKTKLNINGVMPDYLFPTLDGFTDILEIKLPSHDVILKDTNHTGSWRWSPESNKAIGQVVNYLNEIDRLRKEIEDAIHEKYGYELILLKPRAYILIGDSTKWDRYQKQGLRKLNHSMHGIEILTYKDLLDRGNQFTDLVIIK